MLFHVGFLVSERNVIIVALAVLSLVLRGAVGQSDPAIICARWHPVCFSLHI
jgi:hypothetical protein